MGDLESLLQVPAYGKGTMPTHHDDGKVLEKGRQFLFQLCRADGPAHTQDRNSFEIVTALVIHRYKVVPGHGQGRSRPGVSVNNGQVGGCGVDGTMDTNLRGSQCDPGIILGQPNLHHVLARQFSQHGTTAGDHYLIPQAYTHVPAVGVVEPALEKDPSHS